MTHIHPGARLKPGILYIGRWSSNMQYILRDLSLEEVWIIAPVKEAYQIEKGVTVSPLGHFINEINE